MEKKKCSYCGTEMDASLPVCPQCCSAKFDQQIFVYSGQSGISEIKTGTFRISWKGVWILLTVFLILTGVMIRVNVFRHRHSYTSKVTEEPTYQAEGVREFTCTGCGDTYTEWIAVLPSPVKVTVLDKSERESQKAGQYALPDRWVIFDVEVENVSGKDLSQVEGILTVTCGSFSADFYLSVSQPVRAGETLQIRDCEYRLSVLGVDADEQGVYAAKYEDLQFDFQYRP